MGPDTVIDLGQHALRIAVIIASPLLVVALAVGLLIGFFQAATQINESTLSFIPKLGAMVATLFFAGPWMLHTLISYMRDLFMSIPTMIG